VTGHAATVLVAARLLVLALVDAAGVAVLLSSFPR
jgi:hypothetical protein